jgi:hypothetical protein
MLVHHLDFYSEHCPHAEYADQLVTGSGSEWVDPLDVASYLEPGRNKEIIESLDALFVLNLDVQFIEPVFQGELGSPECATFSHEERWCAQPSVRIPMRYDIHLQLH